MREYRSLLIDSEDYEDDAGPGFLVNPRTDERLQVDRFYPPSVAFEFMRQKVGDLLPSRDLTGQDRLIGYLESAGREYMRHLSKARIISYNEKATAHRCRLLSFYSRSPRALLRAA